MSLALAATVRDTTDACRRLLDALAPAQRARAAFGFDAPERRAWHYIPMDRPGLPAGDLDAARSALLHALLGSVLSGIGVATARAIVAHEEILGAIERAEGTVWIERDPARYALAVFGEPGAPPWGWRLEGHHLSLNVTVAGPEAISVLPSFFGANPAEVRSGPSLGLRVLAALEDRSWDLLRSLDPARLARARIAEVSPFDITTLNAPALELGPPKGLSVADMTAPQRAALRALLGAYEARWVRSIAAERAAWVDAELDRAHVAWAGSLSPGEPHHYRIQGPALLVEYVNAQNEANHIHTIWRDAAADFGGL